MADARGVAAWPAVPLGEVLRKSNEWTTLLPDGRYKEVTVRLWGKGVAERREAYGSEIASEKLRVRTDQLILSKIDARNGAVGLVPAHLEGAVVSSDFPVFDIDRNRVLPKFIEWLTKTQDFVALLKAVSEGTTNRVRLKEERFLAIQVPLPALEEQRRIVSRIEAIAAKMEEVKVVRSGVEELAQSLVASVQSELIGPEAQSDWVPLNRYVSRIDNGKSPQCESWPAATDEWGVLKVGAVSFGKFDENENKAIRPGYKPEVHYEVRQGDFLMSRANTRELVGACAIVNNTRPKLLLSDKTFRFVFSKSSEVNKRFLDYVLKSPALREQIERGASGTSPTMKNISKDKVLSLRIPSKTLSEQEVIVYKLDSLQIKIEELKALQSQTAGELDALMPAVLDKAFKGEL